GEERDGGEQPERPEAGDPVAVPGGAAAEELAEADVEVLAHHLRATGDVDGAEDCDSLSHHQRAFVDRDATAHRDRVTLDDTARLELDRAAHAHHITLDYTALRDGQVALQHAHQVVAAAAHAA